MILNKNIQIDNYQSQMSSTGNTKHIFTSGKEKFYFWQLHKGQPSPVYQSFTGMQSAGLIKKGAIVAIGYTEEQESFVNKEGKTVNFTSRCIVGLREAGANATVSEPPKPQSKPISQNLKPTEGVDWDEVAVGKCQTAFLAAFLQAGNTFADAKLQVTQARKLAELVVYGTQQPTKEELPTIQIEDDPANGELNPMVNDDPTPEELGEEIPF